MHGRRDIRLEARGDHQRAAAGHTAAGAQPAPVSGHQVYTVLVIMLCRPPKEALLVLTLPSDALCIPWATTVHRLGPARVPLRTHGVLSVQDAGAKILVTARTDHQLECTRIGPRLHALDDMLQVRIDLPCGVMPRPGHPRQSQ